MKTLLASMALSLTLASGSAAAGQLDKLGGLLGGGSGGSLSSGSMGNAAGILQYCVNNNYLGGDSGASGVKDQLLGKLGGGDASAHDNEGSGSSANDLLGKLGGKSKKSQHASNATDPTQSADYLNGAKGILNTGDGKSFDLAGAGNGGGNGDLKAQITRKACDAVLKQGKKWIGM